MRVWEAATQKCVHVLEGHAAAVTCVAFARPGGKLVLVSGSEDKTLKKWTLDGRSAQTWVAHEKGINDLAVAPKSRPKPG